MENKANTGDISHDLEQNHVVGSENGISDQDNPVTRVCIFARVSTDMQDYDRQINELERYVAQKGWSVTHTIANNLSGSSARNKRPDLDELIQCAINGEFDKVLVSELSRISRKAKIFRQILNKLHELGIAVVFKNLGGLESIDDNGNETFVTNIIISIYAELAQEEARMISERVKSGMENARSKGKQIGRRRGDTKSNEQLFEEYYTMVEMLKNGASLKQCMDDCGVSKNTVIKVKKALKSEGIL